jgi:hypothetical protein
MPNGMEVEVAIVSLTHQVLCQSLPSTTCFSAKYTVLPHLGHLLLGAGLNDMMRERERG